MWYKIWLRNVEKSTCDNCNSFEKVGKLENDSRNLCYKCAKKYMAKNSWFENIE